MLSNVGSIFVGLAFFATLFAIIALIIGVRKSQKVWLRSGKRVLIGSSGLLLFAIIFLIISFLTDQFQIQYVASHSNIALPFELKLSALWAGQEGSLLLWAFLQSLFAALVGRKIDREETDLSSWATIFLAFIAVFFIGMTLVFSNPFIRLDVIPADGQGMNPLLRHPGMVFHPPVLFIGYVGLAVPLAYSLASLVLGDVELWTKKVRSWLVLAWIALGVGIILGARWAYDVLGWGGYWGWDAVENAALMPWLTSTALLHGLSMQIRGKGFKVWNVILAIFSFALVVFGTFTTRSGLIQSVHAFNRSQSGPYFLVLLGLIVLSGIGLLLVKRKSFGNLIYPDRLISREGAFFFTLLLLVLITLSILLGTLLPTLTNGAFSAPPAWFNRVVGPQLGALVFLMGVCPLLGGWFRSIRTSLWRGLPPLFGLIGGLWLAFSIGQRQLIPILGFAVAGFAGGTALGIIGFNVAGHFKNNGFKKGLNTLAINGQSGLGGHLVHFGVVLMAIGVIGTQNYSSEQNLTLQPGEIAQVGAYTLLYEDLSQNELEESLETVASIGVYQDGKYLATLNPQITFYPAYQQTMAEPAIRAGIGEDLYLVLFQFDRSGTINLTARINPLSAFLWVGAFILVVGGTLAWLPRQKKGESPPGARASTGLMLLFMVILFVILWGNPFTVNKSSGRPLPGEIAPQFEAKDIFGDVFSLEEFKGEIVVINFWATWCPQCLEELPEIQSVWEAYQTDRIQFVGIAMDDKVADVAKLAADLAISYPLIVETDSMITSAYGIRGVPETIVIDSTGQIAFFHIGQVDAETLRDEIAVLLEGE